MNIAVLGGGVEGQAVKKYFTERGAHVQIFDNFTDDDIKDFHLEDYDRVFRSPSVHPLDASWTSMTKYFFENCKAKIIGITGTKGKGTTSSMIATILKALIKNSEWPSREVFLVGNIGNPCIEVLNKIKEDDIVVFEMSSFQLWDLNKSPHVAVVLRVEEDHLDRHFSLEDYHNAKANITKYQTENDFCVYYSKNENSKKIGRLSKSEKSTYPLAPSEVLNTTLSSLQIPGEHNKENLEAALAAVASFYNTEPEQFIKEHFEILSDAIKNFKGLKHRIEFVRELDGVKYYDDNYSSAFPATDVALKTFENQPTILIAGGKDRHLNLSKMKRRIFDAKNLKKAILIGETKEKLAENEDPDKFEFADTLEEAVKKARAAAEQGSIILMSPGAASFDMFKNFEDRGQKFQEIVNSLS